MSLRRFLNVAFAILVEEYQRLGVDLMTTLEKLSEWGEAPAQPAGAAPAQPAVARQNEQAMAMLKSQLAGVKGAPV